MPHLVMQGHCHQLPVHVGEAGEWIDASLAQLLHVCSDPLLLGISSCQQLVFFPLVPGLLQGIPIPCHVNESKLT